MSPVRAPHALASRSLTDGVEVVAFTALLCDVVMQLPQEVKRVWMRPGSIARTVYLLNRYITLVCLAMQVYGAFVAWLSLGAVVNTSPYRF